MPSRYLKIDLNTIGKMKIPSIDKISLKERRKKSNQHKERRDTLLSMPILIIFTTTLHV